LPLSSRWVVGAVAAAVSLPAAGTAAGPRAFTRTCDTAVYGELNADWQKDAVVAGPLTLVWALGYATPRSAPPKRTVAHKVLVVVEPATTVTVAIPASAQALASLAYDPRRFNDMRRVRAGYAAVTFAACEQPNGDLPWQRGTQFNGAFIVYGRRCVPIDVSVAGQPAARRLISFGAGACRGTRA
jgi:hypothetical protein